MIELAWAAGFFDGEGCVYFTGKYILLAITQADRRPLDRFRAALGIGIVRGPYRLEKDPYFTYACGVYEVQPIVEKLSPFLSEPKLEQIASAKLKARGILNELGLFEGPKL